MDAIDLEKLGLNKNEAKVYYALLQKNQATASELIKLLGMHRSMIYDNLERLVDKGLVSFVVKETKKYFLAEEPDAIIEFLNTKKELIDKEIKQANKLMPSVAKLLKTRTEEQEIKVFRGIKGLKKVLAEVLNYKENWVIGMSNASVEVLGTTYWKNYNLKVDDLGIKEYFLLNTDFKEEYAWDIKKHIHFRRLPSELTQITEITLFGDYVQFVIYATTPTAILIKDKNLFQTFKQQFDFLWKKSK